MADATGGTPPVGSSPFDPPQHFKDVYDHFGDPSFYSAATASALPDPADSWPGRIMIALDTGIAYKFISGAWKKFGTELPEPVIVNSNATNTVVSAAGVWADLATPVTASLILPAAAWVEMSAAAWLAITANDVRMGINVSGATVSVPSDPQWSNAMHKNITTGSETGTIRKTLKLNAGTNTIKVQGYRTTASGAQTISYPTLEVIPLRWAN